MRRCLALLRLAGPLALVALGSNAGTAAAAPCDEPIQNEIVCENSKPGSPESEWDVSGAGDSNIQGYATDISVDQGETVHFKVDTAANDYQLDIYRMGYYGGDGARQVATVQPSASLPQTQPSCLEDATTGLIDCGNWAESASWVVPADAVSGIYFARLVRQDGTSGASHVVFIVRDDDGGSDLLFQTSDTTWQAYNRYGGNSLYTGSPAGRAYKVSYNRPFTTREYAPEDWVFNSEYPMVRWLERNGYDVSYFTGVDSDRSGGEILEHEAFLSVGHDEYWSAGQRTNVEAARDAGVDLAFFSGNESFWKTRWEDSIAGPTTDHRTLVSYKETHPTGDDDPTDEWTGTWRDDRPINPEGPNPENALTGTMFRVNSGTSAIEVPAADGKMRLWRNTEVAELNSGETETLAADTLGYEWDEAPDNSSRPPGLVHLSSTTRSGVEVLLDNGSTFGPGTATHHLTQYRAPSGALVFGAGTIQWSWGLDGEHAGGGSTPDPDMQQATVNLLADMGSQPDTLQNDLAPATASGDTAAPTSQVTSPNAGAQIEANQQTTISGTATDSGGGEVGAVEVSIDGGAWHPAQGRGSWTYSWTPDETGQTTIRTRAADDSGNLETPGPGITVDVVFTDDVGPDTTPPAISSVSPAAGAAGVAPGANVTATFNEAMNEATINGANFELRDASSAIVPATVSYSAATRTATLDPNNALANSATYTATIKGGTGGVTDTVGNERQSDHTWSFTTAAAPPPPPGPPASPAGPGAASLADGSVAVEKGRIPLKIACAAGADCEGTAKVTKKKVTLAKKTSFSVPGGQTETVQAKLTGKAKKLLKRERRLGAKVELKTEGGGQALTASGTLKIKRKG